MDLKQLSEEPSNEVHTEETLKALEDLPTKIRGEAKEVIKFCSHLVLHHFLVS